MTALFVLAAVAAGLLLALVSFVQLLYRESLRLRPRELPALEYFKDHLDERLALKTEQGALAFSLLRHLLIVLVCVLAFAAADIQGGPLWERFLEGLGAGWLGLLLAAHLVPQVLYRRTEARWLSHWAPFLYGLAWLVRPLISLLSFLQSLAELGRGQQPAPQPPTPDENIEALISAGAEEGLIQEDDRKLIQSAAAFGGKTVREVMTPRPNIVAISEEATLENLRGLVIHEQYSRIPVYQRSIDRVLGFVHVRDMFEREHKEREVRGVSEVMRPIRFVPETKPVDDLLREMQKDGSHLVIVVDEYGNTAGLATLEDLVEEIVGEIRDEHEPAQDFTRDPDGSFVVSGSFDVDRLHDILEYRPGEETESTTIGGLVTEWMGHVPQAGEVAERDGIRIQVISGSPRRVDAVRISRREKATYDAG